MHPRQATAPAGEPSTKQRLVGVDATRGVALLGIMAIHALWAVDDEGNTAWTYDLAAGRSAATFAVLAGVGIALMTGQRPVPAAERKSVAAFLVGRALFIGFIGLLLGFADPEITSVILLYYAVLFLLAIPLAFLPTWALALTAVLLGIGAPVVSHLLRAGLPEASGENPSVGHLLNPGQLITEITLTGTYPALPWMTYICVGLLVGRLRLQSPQVAARLLLAGVVAAVAAAVMSWYALGPLGGQNQLYVAARQTGMSSTEVTDILVMGAGGTTPTSTWWWLATDAAHTSTPLDLLHTSGVAVALLGAFLLLADLAARRSPALTTALHVLAAAGGMTLTLYTAHVVFMNSPLDTFDPTSGYLIQVIAALLFAHLWRQAVGRGPLEALAAKTAQAVRELIPRGGGMAGHRVDRGRTECPLSNDEEVVQFLNTNTTPPPSRP